MPVAAEASAAAVHACGWVHAVLATLGEVAASSTAEGSAPLANCDFQLTRGFTGCTN